MPPRAEAGPAGADVPTLTDLITRADKLIDPGTRRLLGITGPPGAGKSLLAAALAAQLPAVVVPMDGFHLPDLVLRTLRRHDRKGAPDTFDAPGYVALLQRLRSGSEAVAAPAFDRTREETVPAAIHVPRETPLVITEGNYLLLAEQPWAQIRGLLDEVWYVDHPDRIERLVARHVHHGRDPAEAYARATTGSDGDNARQIIATRHRADLILPEGWLVT